jgi:hypothetical protein
MDIEKALFQALQEATRAGCADIEKAAAAARKSSGAGCRTGVRWLFPAFLPSAAKNG